MCCCELSRLKQRDTWAWGMPICACASGTYFRNGICRPFAHRYGFDRTDGDKRQQGTELVANPSHDAGVCIYFRCDPLVLEEEGEEAKGAADEIFRKGEKSGLTARLEMEVGPVRGASVWPQKAN